MVFLTEGDGAAAPEDDAAAPSDAVPASLVRQTSRRISTTSSSFQRDTGSFKSTKSSSFTCEPPPSPGIETVMVPRDPTQSLPGDVPVTPLMREALKSVLFPDPVGEEKSSDEKQFTHFWCQPPCERLVTAFTWHAIASEFQADNEAADRVLMHLSMAHAQTIVSSGERTPRVKGVLAWYLPEALAETAARALRDAFPSAAVELEFMGEAVRSRLFRAAVALTSPGYAGVRTRPKLADTSGMMPSATASCSRAATPSEPPSGNSSPRRGGNYLDARMARALRQGSQSERGLGPLGTSLQQAAAGIYHAIAEQPPPAAQGGAARRQRLPDVVGAVQERQSSPLGSSPRGSSRRPSLRPRLNQFLCASEVSTGVLSARARLIGGSAAFASRPKLGDLLEMAPTEAKGAFVGSLLTASAPPVPPKVAREVRSCAAGTLPAARRVPQDVAACSPLMMRWLASQREGRPTCRGGSSARGGHPMHTTPIEERASEREKARVAAGVPTLRVVHDATAQRAGAVGSGFARHTRTVTQEATEVRIPPAHRPAHSPAYFHVPMHTFVLVRAAPVS